MTPDGSLLTEEWPIALAMTAIVAVGWGLFRLIRRIGGHRRDDRRDR